MKFILSIFLIFCFVSVVHAELSDIDLRDQFCLDKVNEQVHNDEVDLKSISESLRSSLVEFVQAYPLRQQIQEQLVKRIQLIKVDLSYCEKGEGASYNPLSNSIQGCFENTQRDPSLIKFIIAHEFAHSLDICSFHVGPSDFSYNPFTWGKTLSFSDPDNYEKSVKEFPFSAIIKKQPKAIQEFSLNLMNSMGLPKICQRKKSSEMFADSIAFEIIHGEDLCEQELALIFKGFCPTKIKSQKIILSTDKENPNHEIEESMIWSDSSNSLHLDFNSRANNILELWLQTN